MGWLEDAVLLPVFVLGLCFGSFLNVVGFRLPKGQSLLWPGSYCPGCNHRLGPHELVPVFSFIFLRGRCSSCKSRISIRYPAIELLTASLFTATFATVTDPWKAVVWCLFWSLMVAVSSTDLTSMRVPNILSIPGFVVIAVTVMVFGIQTPGSCLVGAAGGFLMMIFLHLVSGGKMGMGDVKLFLSIGAILGFAGAVMSLLFASLAGAVIGGALRIFGILPRRTYIPFVPFILIGTVVSAFFGHDLISWYIGNVLHLK